MYFNGLRLEYSLEGILNFCARKDRMEVVLGGNGALEYTCTDIPKPVVSDAQQLAQWKKDTTKARRIVLEGVKDHAL